MTNIHSDCEVLHTKWGNAKINHNLGYYQISSQKEGNYGKYLHRLIFEKFYGNEIPKGFIIHHKNGDKTDNCILNLQLMKLSEHMRMHHTGENHYNYGGTLSDEHKRKIGNSRRGIKHSEEAKRKISNSSTKNYARVVKHGTTKQGKQYYTILYKRKMIKSSITPKKLFDWFEENYPNERIEWGENNEHT